MSSDNRHGLKSTLASLVVLAFVIGCGGPPSTTTTPPSSSSSLPPAEFPNYPAVANQFRFHWSASPGIDLATAPAVPIRAYLESMRLAAFAGGDYAVVYPGFMRATPANATPVSERGGFFQLQYVRPQTRAEYEASGWKYAERPVFGYQPTHILSLVPQTDGFRATVCLGAYSVYRTADDDPAKFFSTAADPETGLLRYPDGRADVQVWRIELTENDPRAANAPGAPSIAQAGPLPAPTDDVFGKWFITGSSDTGLWGPVGGSENYDTPEVRQQCEAAMPDDAATRQAMATGFHAAPPPHGDPIPGWPRESN